MMSTRNDFQMIGCSICRKADSSSTTSRSSLRVATSSPSRMRQTKSLTSCTNWPTKTRRCLETWTSITQLRLRKIRYLLTTVNKEWPNNSSTRQNNLSFASCPNLTALSQMEWNLMDRSTWTRSWETKTTLLLSQRKATTWAPCSPWKTQLWTVGASLQGSSTLLYSLL